MDITRISTIANTYSEAVRTAEKLQIDVEPEAQLTTPVANLMTAISAEAGLGELSLLREAQLDGLRPDFAAIINGSACGWIELKRENHELDGNKWKGREKTQWELLSQLDSLIVCNGNSMMLYRTGIPVGEACELPLANPAKWNPAPAVQMLVQFFASRPATVRRVSQLADQLAPLARFLRNKLETGLEKGYTSVLEAKEAWDTSVHQTDSPLEFAGDIAQTVAYSMAIAGLSNNAERDPDGRITLTEAQKGLRNSPNNMLAAILSPILGIPALIEFIKPEIAAIERLVSAIDHGAISRLKDSRGEPWLWFYEDFLEKYDPDARKESGVYYTPVNVVQAQVRIINDLLRTKLDRNLGFGAPSVVTLDPATGSGTYPLAIIDQVEKLAIEDRGPGGVSQVAKNFIKNLIAFEILPGPYSVSHLRISQRLSEMAGYAGHIFDKIRIYLTDTLEDPNQEPQKGLFGDAKIIHDEAIAARKVKADEKVTVILGNPPYDRVAKDSGGWVTNPNHGGRALYEDVLSPAREAKLSVAVFSSLYNQYAYFIRWSIWKAFEESPGEPAVVSFITASSWLDGIGFVGLRQLVSRYADECWIVDLGGEGRGSRKDENIFNIQSPVAIFVLYRHRESKNGAAKIYYRRIRGSANEKLKTLDTIERLEKAKWVRVQSQNGESFIPPSMNSQWNDKFIGLNELFPWQQPGVKYNRMWPVAPDKDTLINRWQELLNDPAEKVRAEKFVTGSSGRNIHTKVGALKPLSHLEPGASPQSIVRVGWRAFDRQWTFDDPRLMKTDSPSLWQSRSNQQIYLATSGTEPLGAGQAITASTAVPDMHHFRGSYGGKDIIPLYRDRDCAQPNLTDGVSEMLSQKLRFDIGVEEVASYCFAVSSFPQFVERYWDELEVSNLRIPITSDPELFARAVELGKDLLWLQTYGERFDDINKRPYKRIPRVKGIGWKVATTHIPYSMADVTYDQLSQELTINDGIVSGVSPDVRDYSISGMNVLDRWLGYRTHVGIGNAAITSTEAKPLDFIRPNDWADEWNDELLDLIRVLTETVDKQKAQELLLDEILASTLIGVQEFPKPAEWEKLPPKTAKRMANGKYID